MSHLLPNFYTVPPLHKAFQIHFLLTTFKAFLKLTNNSQIGNLNSGILLHKDPKGVDVPISKDKKTTPNAPVVD